MARTKTRKADAPAEGSGLGRFKANSSWYDPSGNAKPTRRKADPEMVFAQAFEKASNPRHLTRAQIRARKAAGYTPKPIKGKGKSH